MLKFGMNRKYECGAMIKKLILTGFLLMILTISFFALAAYNSEAHATGSTPSDDAEFMSVMNEFLRHPDEPDIYPDSPGGSGTTARTPATPPASPGGMNVNVEEFKKYLNTQEETNNRPEDPAVKIARPSDPEPVYPAEPGTLSGKLITSLKGGAIIAGGVVILVLVGLGMVKSRKKNTAPKPAVVKKTASPMEQSRTKYCTSCGSRLQPDVRFCTNCGEKI